MTYSLLAHLFPRIKGSQEDVATYSLSYILEQSVILNEAFTKLISSKLHFQLEKSLSYNCQDSDSEFGRPDIAGYDAGTLRVLCEAKFYAGLTENQPVSYLKRLQSTVNSGLVFICPRDRIISLRDKVVELAEAAEFHGEKIDDNCMDYSGSRMSVISWSEILAELLRVATERHPEMIGDLRQLEGFCSKVESEAFIPFNDDDFSIQTARNIDRYYEVVDQVSSILKTHKELSPTTKGLRNSPRWQGYSTYLCMDGKGISINYLRNLWKAPTSVITPFWCNIRDIEEGKWKLTDRMRRFLSTIDSNKVELFYGDPYMALIPKPYQTLEELAENLANQILDYLQAYDRFDG